MAPAQTIAVAHVMAYLNLLPSGVIRVVLGLAAAQHRRGLQSLVVGTRDQHTGQDLLTFTGCPLSPHAYIGPHRLGLSPGLLRKLVAAGPQTDIFHTHGAWMFPNWAAMWAARHFRQPLVIAPHGAMDPWAIANPTLQKKLAWVLFDRRGMQSAACLHALSVGEIAALRQFEFPVPIALIPNGVDLEQFSDIPGRDLFEAAFPAVQGRPFILFLSRLHPKKGLYHLAQAWAQIHSEFPDWLLVIAGPDETQIQGPLSAIFQDAGALPSTLFTGPLRGAVKLAAYGASEAMVLPSFSEGFTLVLLEALACSRPVLITPQCYFPEALAAGAGIEIASPNTAATATGLRAMMSLSHPQRQDMGRLGRLLIEQQYTWDAIAARTAILYEWLLGGGPKPDFVHIP